MHIYLHQTADIGEKKNMQHDTEKQQMNNNFTEKHEYKQYLSAQLLSVSVDRVRCVKNLLIVSHVGVLLPVALTQLTRVGWL